MKKYLVFMSMGFEIVGLILGSYFLGPILDKQFEWRGLGFVILSLLSLTGWLVRVIWLIQKLDKEQE